MRSLCLITAVAALGLSACESREEEAREDAAEERAEALEEKAEAAREQD